MDVDIGKVPEPHQLPPTSEPASIPTLDGWIESLMNCKQLAETDVQRLCDRVCQIVRWNAHRQLCIHPTEADSDPLDRLEKFSRMNRTYNQWLVWHRSAGCSISLLMRPS